MVVFRYLRNVQIMPSIRMDNLLCVSNFIQQDVYVKHIMFN